MQNYLGVGVMVWWQRHLLLGRRLSEHGDCCWQFPGGHIEAGETVIQCAEREVREETGLQIMHCRTADYNNQYFEYAGRNYFTLYVSASSPSGQPQLLEPEKCAGWQWFLPTQLPQPLFTPIRFFLQQYPDLRVFKPKL